MLVFPLPCNHFLSDALPTGFVTMLFTAVCLTTLSYDRMLDTRGNTAVYLQFAHARLASILRKAHDEKGVDLDSLKASPHQVSVEHDAERALAFELLVFSDVIEVSYARKSIKRSCEMPMYLVKNEKTLCFCEKYMKLPQCRVLSSLYLRMEL